MSQMKYARTAGIVTLCALGLVAIALPEPGYNLPLRLLAATVPVKVIFNEWRRFDGWRLAWVRR